MRTRSSAVLALALSSVLLTGCGSSQPTTHDTSPSIPAPSAGGGASTGAPLPRGALSDAVAKAAVDFGTYDYRTIQQSGWAFLNDLTASYRNAYAGPATQYVTAVVDGKSVATAKVLSGSLISQSDSQAKVVVTIQQTLNTTSTSTFSLQMTLLRQSDGTWLVDGASPANGGAQ